MLTWLEQPYTYHYPVLLNEIRQGNCVAFVGAGLSKNAGYPLWRELLETLVAQARLHGIIPPDLDIKAYLEIAETCKTALGDKRYYSLLEEIFDSADKHRFLPHHTDMIKIPFAGYLTTNYDMCLEEAANELEQALGVHVYPILDAARVNGSSRGIFHIHGIVYDVSGKTAVQSTVLTSSQFETAYLNAVPIRNFLHSAFVFKTMLFVGCSLSGPDQDPFLPRILQAAHNDYEILRAIASQTGQVVPSRRSHYAILPMHFITDKTFGGTERDKPRERSEDAILEGEGVYTIRYQADGNHTRLTELIEDILHETTPTRTAEPSCTDRWPYLDRS